MNFKHYVLALLMVSSIFAQEYKRFVILIASYNNQSMAYKNMQSAFQDYPETHYRIIFIDDASTDATFAQAQQAARDAGKEHLVSFCRNEQRMGAMYNHYHYIHAYVEDDEIIVILDGDDLLASSHVLGMHLNPIYSQRGVWLTYGQFAEMQSGSRGFCAVMPKTVIRNNSFRKWQDIPSHLRTFYAKLFKQIKKEDLMYQGDWLPMCADMAAMIPMIEMARDHFAFIPQILYLYNDTNPISDHRVSKELQVIMDRYVRGLPQYTPLSSLF